MATSAKFLATQSIAHACRGAKSKFSTEIRTQTAALMEEEQDRMRADGMRNRDTHRTRRAAQSFPAVDGEEDWDSNRSISLPEFRCAEEKVWRPPRRCRLRRTMVGWQQPPPPPPHTGVAAFESLEPKTSRVNCSLGLLEFWAGFLYNVVE